MPKVREAIRIVERDGWRLVRTRGSHRVFKHPDKPGIVVIAGNPGIDMPQGTLNDVLKQAGLKWGEAAMKYAVVIEKGPNSYGAHVPDLPGCVAIAETREEVCTLIREAIELYIEALEEDCLPVPEPQSYELVEL